MSNGTLHEFLGIPLQQKLKRCIYCKEEKSTTEFAPHYQKWDNLDTRCTPCRKMRDKQIEEIRKSAPPVSLVCDCCGLPPNLGSNANLSRRQYGLNLDHDPVNIKFRGWLCGPCNRAIGALGDTLEGLMKAVEYLKRTTL